MQRFLFPRLNRGIAGIRWNEIKSKSVQELTKISDISDSEAVYSQTGGMRVREAHLEEVRERVVKVAEDSGFPLNSKREEKANFDSKISKTIVKDFKMPIGEALKNETWSFVTLILLPDVVLWRFPNAKKERYIGGVRNAFQRLWRRAFLLSSDGGSMEDLDMLDKLTEDAMVAIFERPGVSSNPKLARTIAREWIRAGKNIGLEKMEPVHRDAIKSLRAIAAVRCLDPLSDDKLKELIRECFKQSAVKLNLL